MRPKGRDLIIGEKIVPIPFRQARSLGFLLYLMHLNSPINEVFLLA
jgi:hypothetical protein